MKRFLLLLSLAFFNVINVSAQLQVTSMSIDAPQFSEASGTLVQNCDKEICITVYNNSSSTINRGVRLYLMQGSTQIGEILAHAFQLGAFQSLTICPSTAVVGISAFNGLGGLATSNPGNYTLRLVGRTYSGSPSSYDLGLVYIGDPGTGIAGGNNNQALTIITDATGNCNQTVPCTTPGIPSGVTGSGTGQTAASVSWSAGSPIGSANVTYEYVVGISASVTYGNGVAQSIITGTSASITGLSCGTTYYVRVRARTSCDNSVSNYATSAAFTTSACSPTPPGTPPNPSAPSVNCGSATISRVGSPPNGVTWYWQGTSCGTSTALGSGASYTATSSGTYYIRAYDAGAGLWSTGCGSVGVIVTPVPSVSAGSNSPLASGQTINLTANTISGASYSWTGPNIWTSSTQNPSITNADASMGGQYCVTATVNGCISSQSCTNVVINGTPASLILTGCITPNPAIAVQGNSLTVTATVQNTGGSAWTGDVVLQLLTSQGAYLTDLDLQSAVTIQPNGTVQLNFSTASVSSAPGNYQLRVQYQTTGTSTWADVPQGSCTNPVVLTVQAANPSSDLVLSACITTNPVTVIEGSSLTVTATVQNTGGSAWTGDVVLQLLTAQGAYLTDLDLQSAVTIQPNGTVQLTFTTASVTSAPGNYQLRVQYQTTGTSTWADVPQGSCTNPAGLTVQAANPSSDLVLSGCITPNPSVAIHGSSLTVTATVQNTGGSAWTGDVVLQLLTDQGAYLTDLDLQNAVTIQPNGTVQLNFTTANVVSQPGTYMLRVQYRTGGIGAWLNVGVGGCQNPETLTVLASGGLRLASDIVAVAPQFSLGDGTLVEGCSKDVSFTVTNTDVAPITRGIQVFLMDDVNSTVVTNIFAHAFTLAAGQSITFDQSTLPVGINSFNGLGGITTSTPNNYNLLLRSYVTTETPANFDLWLVTYAASFDVPTEACGTCVNPQPITVITDATSNCNAPVGIEGQENDEFRMWPNPVVDGTLHLAGLPEDGCVISLYDMQGRKLMQQSLNGQNSATIDLSTTPTGIYLMNLLDTNGSHIGTEKLLNTH